MASRTDSARTDVSSGNSRVSRRLWLASSAAALGTTLIPGTTASPLTAAEPPVRDGRSFMKLSLAAYSFNRSLPRNWPKPRSGNPTMSLLDFIDFCAAQDLDACELTSYYFPADVTNEYLMTIKNRTFRLGLDISGTAIGNDFCLPNGPDREFQLEMTRKWIDYAALMGAPVIRIFAGKVPKGETEEVALDRCVAGINQSLEYAATKGVVLALENHGGITATPEQLLRIVERVDETPWFGINFDSGNFRTDDPYGDLEKIAPYAVNAQVKVAITSGGQKQEADLSRIVGILQDAGLSRVSRPRIRGTGRSARRDSPLSGRAAETHSLNSNGGPLDMVQPIPPGHHSLAPHLVIRGASAAIEFYKSAFNAEEISRMPWPNGEGIMHAELQIGDSRLFLCDETPPMERWVSPKSLNGTAVALHLWTDDAEGAFERAVNAGSRVEMPLTDMFWGDRYGRIIDPFGHEWAIAQHIRDMTPEEIQAAAEQFAAPENPPE